MNPLNGTTPQFLQELFNDIIQYQNNIPTARVTPESTLFSPSPNISSLPEHGSPIPEVYKLFKTSIQPHLPVSKSPRNFSFVTGGITPAAFVGELLVTTFDQNLGAGASLSRSIAPLIEEISIKLLCDLFNLGRDHFTGTLTTGATMSNLVGILCARQWIGNQQGIDVIADGLANLSGPIQVFANCPHSSVLKVLGIAGLGRKITKVKGLQNASSVIDPADLENCLKESMNQGQVSGKIVVVSAGDVNTGSFDNITTICKIAKKYGAWIHVDGAFGLFAQCSPKYSHLTEGIQMADSITSDGHKWLNVGYDCGLFFINAKHGRNLLNSVFSTSAAYIAGDGHPMNRSLENSKRFRALPIWMSLQTLGRSGYQEIVEKNCEFAQKFGNWIDSSVDFLLMAKVTLNIVTFRARDDEVSTTILLDKINETGLVFMTSTVLDGVSGIRCAICNWQTSIEEDFEKLVQALQAGIRSVRG